MYYEIKMSRYGLDEAGNYKKFNEMYLLEDVSLMAAVTRFEEWVSSLFPEHNTVSAKSVEYAEVNTDADCDNIYYKAKFNMIDVDDRSGKEKKKSIVILIQANSFDDAKAKYEIMADTWMADVTLVKLSETNIIEYLPSSLGNQK